MTFSSGDLPLKPLRALGASEQSEQGQPERPQSLRQRLNAPGAGHADRGPQQGNKIWLDMQIWALTRAWSRLSDEERAMLADLPVSLSELADSSFFKQVARESVGDPDEQWMHLYVSSLGFNELLKP